MIQRRCNEYLPFGCASFPMWVATKCVFQLFDTLSRHYECTAGRGG